MKKALKAIFFPHVAIVALIALLSFLSLIYSIVRLEPLGHISIISYILSAYSVVAFCCTLPTLIKKLRRLASRLAERREEADPAKIAQFKINVALYGTFFYNSVYAIFTLFLGLWHSSNWYLSIAAYYILLAIMRFSLLYYSRSNKAGEDLVSELNRFRFCGVVLLIMNTALSAMTIYQTIVVREFAHHGATTAALAIFTLSLFTLSIINIIKYRKFNSPILFAAKLVSFVSALVSMLSLETAVISNLGAILNDRSQRAITGVSAFSVLAIIAYIGIFMVARGNKSLKALKDNSEVKK